MPLPSHALRPRLSASLFRASPPCPSSRNTPARVLFHSSPRRPAEHQQNHYQVLELPTTASPAEIKRQFYALSKKHHPDHNASDPHASTRFVAISEAYHVLSVPEKRAQYDATIHASHSHGRAPHQHYPHGSYSSASYAGSRPASGLNKKRSTFRGPPPSFYQSGGYGRHGAKRTEYASYQHAGEKTEQETDPGSYGRPGGFGAGQATQGNEVPHFDDRRHKETHHQVYEHINARRRKTRADEVPEDIDRGGMLINFVMVSGVVAIAGIATKVFA